MKYESRKQNHLVYLITAALVIAAVVFMNKKEVIPMKISNDIRNNETQYENKIVEGLEAGIQNSKLVSSLVGTHHGVHLKSHNQELIITASLKDLFDYYLSAAGEESIKEIDQRIQAELAQQLKEKALMQGLVIWKNYLNYKNELVTFDQQYSLPTGQAEKSAQLQMLQQRQLALLALQDQIFGTSVAEILFKFDRQLDTHTLNKAILLASNLTSEQIQQRLINLSAQLSIETISSLQRNQKQQILLDIDRHQGLNAQQKFQQREQQVGAVAANRLQLLDEKRAHWKRRIADFKQRQQQLKKSGLATAEYQTSLDKTYAEYFMPEEQLRARALTTNGE